MTKMRENHREDVAGRAINVLRDIAGIHPKLACRGGHQLPEADCSCAGNRALTIGTFDFDISTEEGEPVRN